MKKVTLKDIASRAGVSIATVSYVLNNKTNQKISKEIKEKVLETAYDLNYVPNIAARTLVNKKSSLMGIVIIKNDNEKPWEKFLYLDFIEAIVKIMSRNNYDIILSTVSVSRPKIDIVPKREIEGVFLINVRGDIFYKLSTKISAPLVIVDSLIDDTYFYKINWNIEKAVASIKKNYKKEDLFLVTNKFNNKSFMEYIEKTFKRELVYEMDSVEGLKKFLEENKDRKGIIVNEFIGQIATRFIDKNNITVICICGSEYLIEDSVNKIVFSNKKKASVACSQLIELINKKYDRKKDIYINHD
ncbi:hypothetical protein SH1V18_29880 [Vallitalea longa]|uniref:HTH lacI-type domain-containing protein n=1 Tax=Vallitalea longa TaxID=2936439 RepID=A0A9W5YG01_9FIRM|nr:LacI family DNA-binding transcriptional regulator [Vallitalea longa]GKX30508.1 hypothetical protein SH1V18_29880 [Vallitalea longa]